MTDEDAYALIMLIIIAALIGFGIGLNLGSYRERTAAISAGVARYEVNPTTGETRFVYLKPGEVVRVPKVESESEATK